MGYFGPMTRLQKTKIKVGDTFYRDHNRDFYMIVTQVNRSGVYCVDCDGDVRWYFEEILKRYYTLGPKRCPPKYKCINPVARKIVWARKLSRMYSFVMKGVRSVALAMREDFIRMGPVSVLAVMIMLGVLSLLIMKDLLVVK